jgi:AcrR family transcriptional regulator
MVRRTQEARSAQTIARVLAVAERHFAVHGYEAVSTEALVAEAGLTRGALYHHFGSKKGLFEAVVGDVQGRLARAVAEAAEDKDPWDALIAGCRAWLVAATDPTVRRILLLDAPAVLGWERWRALDTQGGGRLLHEGVQACVACGLLETPDPEALVQLLNGAMNQAALWVAVTDEHDAALAAATATLERLLSGLRVTQGVVG